MKGRPYIALGCTQQSRVTPTKALNERVMAGRALGDLLLATGAIEGPFKRSRHIPRWRLVARRFLAALGRFLAAPKCDL